MNDSRIAKRKTEHLRIVAQEDVTHSQGTLLDCVHLLHQAAPELNLEDIDSSTQFFGKELSAPLMICGMSGGDRMGRDLNRDLAHVASSLGVAFSVGSQRIMLEQPDRTPDFAMRPLIPDGVLLGNIGAPQLLEIPTADIAGLAARIDADGLCVHLNVAQELCQPEGDRRFAGQLDGIARLVEVMPGQVMVKETGAGMSPRTFELLRSAGVTRVDVAGAGGTSWTRVEMFRAQDQQERAFAETFADWGVPTAVSLIAGRRVLGPSAKIVGSGGIRNGLDCARAIAAGADIAGMATPVFLAWQEGGQEGAAKYLSRIKAELRAAMLLTGSADVEALRSAPRVHLDPLRRWLKGLQA